MRFEIVTYYLRWRIARKQFKLSLGHGDPGLAEKQRQQKEAQLNESGQVLRVSELVSDYLSDNEKLKPSTRSLTDYVFSQMTLAIGDIDVKSFDYSAAEKFQSWIIKEHKSGESTIKARSKMTANIWVKTASPIFSWAVRKKTLSENPFSNLSLFDVKPKRIHVYTAQEVGELLNACNSRIWYARILCAKTTAMRRGEILNLHIDDVDFKNDIIYVQPKENAKNTWHFEPKDNELRELPLISDLKEVLLELKAYLPKEQPYFMIPADRYARVIEMKRRGILKDRLETCPDENWRQPFERIKDRADVVKGTFHDLRRTCITEWLESGLKPHEVMRLAGHSDIETTMTYYAAIQRELTDKARAASKKCLVAAA